MWRIFQLTQEKTLIDLIVLDCLKFEKNGTVLSVTKADKTVSAL